LDKVVIKAGILGEFGGIHPMPLNMRKTDFLRQMGNPATHHVKHAGTWLEPIAIKIRQALNKTGIDVGYQAGNIIKL
jgi:hypothetical protein